MSKHSDGSPLGTRSRLRARKWKVGSLITSKVEILIPEGEIDFFAPKHLKFLRVRPSKFVKVKEIFFQALIIFLLLIGDIFVFQGDIFVSFTILSLSTILLLQFCVFYNIFFTILFL